MNPAILLLAALLAIAIALAWRELRRARHAEVALRAARDRADRAVQAREAFFDLATHELRSPLAAILGYQELLQDGAYGPLDPRAAEPVERIGHSAHHLLNLIDGVVELSRLRSGSVRPDLQPVNLHVVISGVAEAFRTHARDRSLEPEVHLHGAFPTILSDPDRLLRALDLLVTSAVKHPADKRLRFHASSSGDDLEIRIEGTALELQEHEDPPLRMGIRLAVAAGLADLLGGGLQLETTDDGRVVRALRFRIRDLAGRPATRFDAAAARG